MKICQENVYKVTVFNSLLCSFITGGFIKYLLISILFTSSLLLTISNIIAFITHFSLFFGFNFYTLETVTYFLLNVFFVIYSILIIKYKILIKYNVSFVKKNWLIGFFGFVTIGMVYTYLDSKYNWYNDTSLTVNNISNYVLNANIFFIMLIILFLIWIYIYLFFTYAGEKYKIKKQ